ncbi:unnamed protein product [Prunus brigantina]
MSWDFKAPGAPHPSYSDPELFSIRMYHGGQICGNCYSSGSVAWFDYCDKDRMSMTEIDNMVRELGYDGVISYCNEGWFYSQSGSNMFVDVEVDIVPNRGVVIEELDDNYGAIVPLDKERAVERESPTTVDKGKSKISSVFGKRRARAFGKRRCKNVKKTCDKEDQRSNTVTEGLVQKEVVEGNVEKRNLSRCHPMKTRKARTRTTVCDDEEESADSLDSDFADPNFSCDDNDDDDNFDEWVDKQIEWVGDGAKGKEPESTNAGVESWDWGADVELDSEEYDSDNVQPKYDSYDDTPMMDRWPKFNPATDMADPEFEVWMKFSDCKVFRAAVREQFIKRNRDVVFVRSEALKLKEVCADPDCPWEIYASKMQHEKTLQVKKYEGEHTCGIVWENPTVKSSWLSAKYMETLKSNPSWPFSSFMETVEKDYNTGVSRQQVYRAKERALRQIERQVVPNSEHRFCARHLFTNFRLQFKGKALSDKFWGVAKATNVPQSARQMKELKNLDIDAYDWLTEPGKPPRHLSRSHFNTHVKCDMLLNNMCESFNSFILACRDKPILTVLEIVRYLTGWPCVHGVVAINYNGALNVMDYVDACYHTQTYFKAYENLILPMNRMELWDITNMPPCVPPSYSKQPRRPRKARRKEAGECSNKANVVTKVQDSLSCGQYGRMAHNKRTCHRNLPPKTKIKKRKAEQTTQTSEAGPSTKTRQAKFARSVQKGKWKRKATNAAGSSNAPPTDSAAPSSTPATGSTSLATRSAPPASTEASTDNSYLLRKRPMVVGASDLSKE